MTLEQALINNGSAANAKEAQQIISELRQRIFYDDEIEDPEELLYEYGLEPDYVMDLLIF